MKLKAPDISLPLLAKELTERAARPRTYVLRFVYALLLFGFCLVMLQSIFWREASPVIALGSGRQIFYTVVWVQVLAIFIFLPAMMADAVTSERERGSLELLMITSLRPWDIVLQKIASRLIPMATLLMLSLPLLAVAYAYGGVTASTVWTTAYILALTCVQVGVICFRLAADASTTASAMLSCYIRLPLVYLALLILSLPVACVGGLVTAAVGNFSEVRTMSSMVPPLILLADAAEPTAWLVNVLWTMPTFASIGWFLHKGRETLSETALLRPGIDRPEPLVIADIPSRRAQLLADEPPVVHALSARLAGSLDGMMRLKRHKASPAQPSTTSDQPGVPQQVVADRPIAWRERHGHLMAQLTLAYRVFMLVTLPCLVLLMASIHHDYRSEQSQGMMILTLTAWAIAGPVVALLAAGAIVSERVHQSLEVLLTTPIPTDRLLGEKLEVVVRSANWLIPMFIVLMAVEVFVESQAEGWSAQSLLYIVCSLLAAVVYLRLAVWLGAWVGLGVRNRARAILLILGIFGGWAVAVPWLTNFLLASGNLAPGHPLQATRLLNPASVLLISERSQWELLPLTPWLVVPLTFLAYGLFAGAIRRHCQRRADQYLGRIAQPRAGRTPVNRAARRLGDAPQPAAG